MKTIYFPALGVWRTKHGWSNQKRLALVFPPKYKMSDVGLYLFWGCCIWDGA